MAAALGLALAGPRTYGAETIDDAWMNAPGRQDANAGDIQRALQLFVFACALHAAAVACLYLVARNM